MGCASSVLFQQLFLYFLKTGGRYHIIHPNTFGNGEPTVSPFFKGSWIPKISENRKITIPSSIHKTGSGVKPFPSNDSSWLWGSSCWNLWILKNKNKKQTSTYLLKSKIEYTDQQCRHNSESSANYMFLFSLVAIESIWWLG